jgi:hypothetical protein
MVIYGQFKINLSIKVSPNHKVVSVKTKLEFCGKARNTPVYG